MKFNTCLSALLYAILVGNPCARAVAAEDVPLHEWGKHGDDELYEGAITVESQGGVRKVAMALGAQLGKESVDGIEVGLFVLQASNPEQLKPGAKGPTHLFNVTLLDEEAGELIKKEALGSVIIEREGRETQHRPLKPLASHHQASARLDERGEYQVSVEFVAAGRKGHTGAMPFNYTGKLMFHSHGQDHDNDHDHEDH